MVFMAANNKNPGVPNIHVPDILDSLNSRGQGAEDSTCLSLDKISFPESQPRRYFDPQKLEQLKNSIKEHGILEPLLVRPLENGSYELVAGERRYRAAKEAGLEEVPVVIRELDDKKAYQLALVENLQREDLNPIEETEGILELLSLELDTPKKEVISLIDQALNTKKRGLEFTENVFSKFEKIESVLATTSKLTVESFRTARLPLLNLPEEILEFLRQGRIEYTKARAIARIKDGKQRQSLLEVAIAEDLSLSQIKEKIAKLKTTETKGKGGNADKAATYPQRLKDIYTKAKKVKSWDDPEKQQEFELLLEKMEKML
jgi:ParB family transcriptional regulator, chromosome partitioning protein